MFIQDKVTHTMKLGDESEKNIFDPDSFSDYKETLAFLLDNKRVRIKRPGGRFEVISFEKTIPDTRRPGHQRIIAETGEIIDDDFVSFHSPLYHIKNLFPRFPEKFRETFRSNVSEMIKQWNGMYNELKAQHLPVCMPDTDYFMDKFVASLESKSSFDNAIMSYAHEFLGAMQYSIRENAHTYENMKAREKK